MGTVLEVTLSARSEAEGRAALERAFARAAALESVLSTFDPASDASRLNARAGAEPGPLAPELERILRESAALTARTRGAFDVSVGPLVALWKRAEERGSPPSPREIRAARSAVGAGAVVLLEGGRAALRKRASIDLGGIAKGFALDRIAEDLREAGVASALLSFGQSSVVALGQPGDAGAWRLLLRDAGDGFAGTIALRDQALSVSASLGHVSEIAGRRFGHVIDPRTGAPLERALVAAVLAPSATEAEGFSKALLILGESEGIALLGTEPGVEGMLADQSGRRAATSGFDRAARFEPLAVRP
jgi:thiamine biosynthesis lipoprotein